MLKTLIGTFFLVLFCQGQMIKTPLTQRLSTPGDSEVSVLELDFAPGDPGIGPHVHPGPVIGYVVDGEFLFQVEGGPLKILKPGCAFAEEYGAVHVWGGNASNTTSARVVAVVMGRPGQPVLTMVPGKQREDYATAVNNARSASKGY